MPTTPDPIPNEQLVLVVDDDRVLRQAVRFALETAGFAVREAANGTSAAEALRQGPMPAAIVTDYMMPGSTGVDLAFAVRNELGHMDIPIIVLTAVDEETGDIARLHALTGVSLLRKPAGVRQIASEVRRVVSGTGTADLTT